MSRKGYQLDSTEATRRISNLFVLEIVNYCPTGFISVYHLVLLYVDAVLCSFVEVIKLPVYFTGELK